jgi:hypothetical protein
MRSILTSASLRSREALELPKNGLGSLRCASRASFYWLLLFAAACGSTGTDLKQIVNGDPFSDAGGTEVGTGGGAGASIADPFAGAPAYSPQTGDNSHNAGKSCLQSGCHGSGGEAPNFLIGGTVYSDYAGTMPASGVEVRIVDSAGHAVSTHSGPEGNFYIGAGGGGITFPANVGARDGTTARPMVTTLTSSMASCGQSTCHVPGGGPTTNTGNYYPIHVP